MTRPGTRAPDRPAATSTETAVNAYLDAFEQDSASSLGFVLRRPGALLVALRGARALPAVAVAPSGTGEGRMLRRIVLAMRNRVHTPLHAATAVLTIPEAAGEYGSGSSKQTLRRKVRAAERSGITWATVEDRGLRRALMDLADVHEQTHEDERYRTDGDGHGELVEHGLWLVARSKDGDPLLLSVTPIDGDLAALRYFRTLRSDDDASVARYLMTQVLVEQLRRRGVRHLIDTTPSMRLPHGLRHFQRMVGFRLMRVELRPEGRLRPATGAPGPLSDAVLARGALVAVVAAFGSEVLPAVLSF